jgi:hypothetical protein
MGMPKTDPLPTVAGCDTISPLMIREAIIAERDRRGWNNNRLAQESGVPYPRLHVWLTDAEKSLTTKHLESLMAALGLRICRGKAK